MGQIMERGSCAPAVELRIENPMFQEMNLVLLFNSHLTELRNEADDNTRSPSFSASVTNQSTYPRIVKLGRLFQILYSILQVVKRPDNAM
jgi:hypothetical protein